MRKRLFLGIVGLLFATGAYCATTPATLTIQGSALNESTDPVSMKLVGNTYELFTSLKSGEYSFSDASIQQDNITVEGENTPYCIRVNYDGETPAVTVKKVEKVILWAPWKQYTVGELNYVGNFSFKGEQFSGDIGAWGDNRYRIRIIFGENDFETYGNEFDYDPDDNTPQSYYDLYLTQNDQWFNPDKKYKLAKKYQGKYFNVEVKLSNTENYTHYITEYIPETGLPIADQLQIESDDALENGSLAMFNKVEEGVFAFVGGLKAGSFKIKGQKGEDTYYYSLSDNNELTAVEKPFAIEETEVTPYFIKIDLTMGMFKMQPINSCYLNFGSGSEENRIPFTYDANGRFTAQSLITVPMADWGRPDERYKFYFTLADASEIAWGHSIEGAEMPDGPDYYRLNLVNNDKWAYSFKFPSDFWDKPLNLELLFSPDGNYKHAYNIKSDTGTGITDYTNNMVNVFPTAVQSELTVKTQKTGFSVEIFNTAGTKILETSANGRELQIDGTNMPTGIYLLKVTQAGNVLTTQRVIKK